MGTSTLKSTGGDFTSITTWENTKQGALTEPEILECYKGTTVNGGWQADGSLNEGVTLAGWATDQTNNITIRPGAGQGHDGVLGEGFTLAFSTPNASTMLIRQVYTVVQDITVGIKPTGTSARGAIEFNTVSNDSIIERCFITNEESLGGEGTGIMVTAGERIITRNNAIVLDLGSTGGSRGIIASAPTEGYIDNNTIIGDATDSIYCGLDVGSLTNNVTYNTGQNFDIRGTLTPVTCFSSDGSGSTTVIDSTAFVNYPSDLRPAEGGPLDGSATDLDAFFSDDIAGDQR